MSSSFVDRPGALEPSHPDEPVGRGGMVVARARLTPPRALWIWIIVGLLVRLLFGWLYRARVVEGITVSYFDSAADLVAGDPFQVASGIEIMHPYGYSTLIAAIQIFTGSNDSLTLLFLTGTAIVLDSATVALVYVVASRLHSHRSGLWAAGIYALSPLPALACIQPTPEALTPFVMALVLAGTSLALGRSRRWWGLVAGIGCGLALNLRSELLLLPLGIAAYLGCIRVARRESRQLAVLALVTVLFALPMVLGTWWHTGTPRINTTNAGGTMWQGLGERPDNPWGLRLGDKFVMQRAEQEGFPSAWGPEANAYFKAEFKDGLREHPAAYADLILTRRIPQTFDAELMRWNFAQYAVGIHNLEQSKYGYAVLRAQGIGNVLRTSPGLLIVSEEGGWYIKVWAWFGFAALAIYTLVNLRRPQPLLLLLLPFAYLVGVLCVIKFVEPRQFFTLFPIYCIAGGWLLSRRRQPAPPASGATNANPMTIPPTPNA